MRSRSTPSGSAITSRARSASRGSSSHRVSSSRCSSRSRIDRTRRGASAQHSDTPKSTAFTSSKPADISSRSSSGVHRSTTRDPSSRARSPIGSAVSDRSIEQPSNIARNRLIRAGVAIAHDRRRAVASSSNDLIDWNDTNSPASVRLAAAQRCAVIPSSSTESSRARVGSASSSSRLALTLDVASRSRASS